MQPVQSGENTPIDLRAAFSSQVSPPLKPTRKMGNHFSLSHFASISKILSFLLKSTLNIVVCLRIF